MVKACSTQTSSHPTRRKTTCRHFSLHLYQSPKVMRFNKNEKTEAKHFGKSLPQGLPGRDRRPVQRLMPHQQCPRAPAMDERLERRTGGSLGRIRRRIRFTQRTRYLILRFNFLHRTGIQPRTQARSAGLLFAFYPSVPADFAASVLIWGKSGHPA